MQATSQLWKDLVAADSFNVEAKAIINGVEYTEISAPLITRSLMQDGLSIGNVISANCQITIMTDNAIPKSAEVQVKMRLVSYPDSEMYDEGEAPEPEITEWLPAGTYYISRRTKDPVNGVITLDCYDALLRANAEFHYGEPWIDGQGTVVPFDPSMASVVDEISYLADIEIDPNTVINTGADYVLDPAAPILSMRDALAFIAQAHGANWFVTPNNKLRLVPLVSSSDAEEATSNAVDTIAVLTSISVSDSGTITGVLNTYDDTETLIGNDNGLVIATALPISLATLMSADIIGLDYKPYALGGTIYNPAVELGDYLRNKQSVRGVVYSETVTLGMAFRGDLSAPEPIEIADEYPYIGASERALIQAKQAVKALDASLTPQEVFDRLTNNGAMQGLYIDPTTGQIYINASYIRSGTLILGGLNNQNGLLEVQDASGTVFGTLNKDGFTFTKTSQPGNLKRDTVLKEGSVHFYANNSEAGAFYAEYGTLASGAPSLILYSDSFAVRTTNNSTIFYYYNGTFYIQLSNLVVGGNISTYSNLYVDGTIETQGTIKQNGYDVLTTEDQFTISDVVLASGTATLGNIAAGARGTSTVSFASVGTSNYMVVLTPLVGEISCGVQNKTDTSFTLYYKNTDTANTRVGTVNWAIIKLP